jgi:hypothetical protein
MEWRVLTSLQTVKIGRKLWMLTAPMVYRTPHGNFLVPAGFITDHASVPRIFTSIIPPVQSAIAEASILHDWFYSKDSRIVSRKFADLCLRELTIANGGSKALGGIAWAAVRVGGRSSYRHCHSAEKIKQCAYPFFRGFTQDRFKVFFKIKE